MTCEILSGFDFQHSSEGGVCAICLALVRIDELVFI